MTDREKCPRASYNHYVHSLANNAKLLLESLSKTINKLPNSDSDELSSSDSDDSSSSDSDDSSSSDSDDSDSNDSHEWEGETYYYHPPKINDRVRILWELKPVGSNSFRWYPGKIAKIIKAKKPRGAKAKKPKYEIKYDDGSTKNDHLKIDDFPAQWNFE